MSKPPWKKLLNIVATKGSASIYRTSFNAEGEPLFIVLDASGGHIAMQGTAEQIAKSILNR